MVPSCQLLELTRENMEITHYPLRGPHNRTHIQFFVVANFTKRQVKHRKDCKTALVGKERLDLKIFLLKDRLYLKSGLIWFYLKKTFVERNALL